MTSLDSGIQIFLHGGSKPSATNIFSEKSPHMTPTEHRLLRSQLSKREMGKQSHQLKCCSIVEAPSLDSGGNHLPFLLEHTVRADTQP